jgi:AraC family transcriptional regulator, arabinose operon regulatory protein
MDARVTWAMSVIEKDLRARLDVAALAAGVNLSRSRFAHLFRRETGLSPARFVRLRRLDRARVLLETTFLTVKQVMAIVGLNDQSHFSRAFRAHHGVSPRRWRTTRKNELDPLEVAFTVK